MSLRIRTIPVMALLIVVSLFTVGLLSTGPEPVRAATAPLPTGGGPVVLRGHVSVLGGDGLVVLVGLAGPVKTPSIGVPVKP